MKKLICLLILIMLVGGCATRYGSQGFKGGYADVKIQDDIFKISFKGNAYLGSSKCQDYTLLRAAEVALENGYKYFIILDEKSGTQQYSHTTPVTANTYGTANVYGSSATYSGRTSYSGGQTYNFNKPRSNLMIRCFKEKPEDSFIMLFDAKQIKNNLRLQYNLGGVLYGGD